MNQSLFLKSHNKYIDININKKFTMPQSTKKLHTDRIFIDTNKNYGKNYACLC